LKVVRALQVGDNREKWWDFWEKWETTERIGETSGRS
jgi:hypothetical protein